MTITPLLKPHETHLFKQLYTYVYWAILQILNDTYYSFLWEKITNDLEDNFSKKRN